MGEKFDLLRVFKDLFRIIFTYPHAHSASEHGGHRQVSAVSWVAGSHHVLGVEHLKSTV